MKGISGVRNAWGGLGDGGPSSSEVLLVLVALVQRTEVDGIEAEGPENRIQSMPAEPPGGAITGRSATSSGWAPVTSSATSVPAELPDASGTMGLPTGCANAVAPAPMVMVAAMPRVAAVRAIFVVRLRKSIPHVSG